MVYTQRTPHISHTCHEPARTTHCVTPLRCLRFKRKNKYYEHEAVRVVFSPAPKFLAPLHHPASVLCFPASFTFDSPAPRFPSLHNHLLISKASYDPSFILLPYFLIHFTLCFGFFLCFQSLQLPFGFSRFRYFPSFRCIIITNFKTLFEFLLSHFLYPFCFTLFFLSLSTLYYFKLLFIFSRSLVSHIDL